MKQILQQFQTLFSNPEWKENIDFALLLNCLMNLLNNQISSIAFFQCVSLKLHENPMLIQTNLFSKVLSDMRNILEQIYQTLLILMNQILGKVPQENRSNVQKLKYRCGSKAQRKQLSLKKQETQKKMIYLIQKRTINLQNVNQNLYQGTFKITEKQLLIVYYKHFREFQKQFLIENTEIERIKPIFSVISFCLRERNNIQCKIIEIKKIMLTFNMIFLIKQLS